ncbi:helix-hairpin-helix domain-containing protein [Scandinavium sp. H11S7]|uniref:helix-hairpin-helix domain-containing protein n=1 Tax=Scandinavium hiltneri TaxID=2926519 RepID=UPI0021662184|nr:helix-hairpin-helix domain-containing protein [Scandinavium hiltneri]MCS2157893.1 helix-hairpin-helix domain-containing protein [Scandinavium hiltneri]
MKSGIKTVLLVLTLAISGIGSHALAATAAGKPPVDAKSAAGPASPEKLNEPTTLNQSAGDKVSINTASADELARVMNGVGLKKAQAIVSYREEYGPFKAIDDLRQVPGMGGALVERNLSHLML